MVIKRWVMLGVVAGALAAPASAHATAEVFSARLTGAQEVPPVASGGSGSGLVYLNAAENQITVDMSFTGLGSNAILAHIHGPAPVGVDAGVLFDLGAGLPNATSGSIATVTFAITGAQVTQLRSGLFYFNVHSENFPGGEIRGQIGPSRSASQLSIGTMRGVQENPVNASAGTGKGTVFVNAAQNQITVDLGFAGLGSNAMLAHIHGPGAPGANAGIMFDLTPGLTNGTSGTSPTKTFGITAAQLTQLRAGLCYLNVHTSNFPGGEVRGQLYPAQSWPALARASTTWLFRNSQTAGAETTPSFVFGARPMTPLTGDWDANGSETPGFYRNGQFELSNTYTGTADSSINYSSDPRGFPLSGDFNGDARDDVAVYRNGLWNVSIAGAVPFTFSFGAGSWPATVPVVGDWNGDGIDGIGTYNRSTATFSLRNTANAGGADQTFVFGTANASYPVVGDWNGDGIDTVGVKSTAGAAWALDNNSPGVDFGLSYGLADDLPLTWR